MCTCGDKNIKRQQQQNNNITTTTLSVCIPITLFTCLTMLCGTDNIPQNIPGYSHIQSNYKEYSLKYYQSHKTLLWIY